MECKTCKYLYKKENVNSMGGIINSYECRYNPPTKDGFTIIHIEPECYHNSWCSKYKNNNEEV